MTLNTYFTRSADQLLEKTIFTKSPRQNINFVSSWSPCVTVTTDLPSAY